MRFAPSLAFKVLFFIATAVIFGYAAWQRFSFPLLPAADPDTWGYLRPALSALSGEGFVQTYGRSFLYPFFLWGILTTTGSFTAIVVAQHIASLVTGLVWLSTWFVWISFLPQGWTRRFLAPVFGLAALTCYLTSSETVIFGLRIRPEGLFPLFALLQIFFLLVFIRVRWRKVSPKNSAFSILIGALALLFAVAAYNLKPSWGFALLLSPLVLFLAIIFQRQGRPLILAASPLVTGCLLVFLFLFALPKAMGWKPDEASGMFLPMLLFSVHADIGADYLLKNASHESASAGEREMAQRLKQGVADSRSNMGPYNTLGFNPDYLMFDSDVLKNIPGVHTTQQYKTFYFRTYFFSLIHNPLRFIKKWAIQLKEGWFLGGKYLARFQAHPRKYFEHADICLLNAPPNLRPDVASGYQSVRQNIAATLPVRKDMGPAWLKTAGSIGAFLYAPLAAAIFMASIMTLIFRKPEWQSLHFAVWTAALVAGAAFLSSLTVAIVHSFDIDRYLYLQAFLAWLVIACGSTLLVTFLEMGLRRFPDDPKD